MPVFVQYWWLDAVSVGKDWDVLLVHEDDETKPIIAAMPYEYCKMLWGRIAQPQEMTPYGGATVILAMSDGRKAAAGMHARLSE